MKTINANGKSLTSKIFEAIKMVSENNKETVAALDRGFWALMSRRTLGQTLAAMYDLDYGKQKFRSDYSIALSRLKGAGFIKFSDRDLFTLTNKGKEVLLKFDIDNIKLADFNAKEWDGNWRVLIFDIPEITRAIRNLFRDKIQELGFYTLQKSVYVTPQLCEKEILRLARILKIERGVHILEAAKLGRKDSDVRRFFGVT